jgi:plasmid stabilization system protein ParE
MGTHYITQERPSAAEEWVAAVFSKVALLRSSPEIGNTHFREILYGNYRIIYRIEMHRISILTIRHGKQILPADEILNSK